MTQVSIRNVIPSQLYTELFKAISLHTKVSPASKIIVWLNLLSSYSTFMVTSHFDNMRLAHLKELSAGT